MSKGPQTENANVYYKAGIGVTHYDLWINTAVVDGDIAFYLACARQFGEPVLELATGTGRVLVAMAEQGVEITGLDLSPAMLAQAEVKVRARGLDGSRVQLVHGDMTNFELGRTFGLVIVPFRSFQHVVEPEAQRSALLAMHRHLKPGGHVVIDLFDARFDLLVDAGSVSAMVRAVQDPVSGNTVRRTIAAREVDFVRQVVHEVMRLEVIDPPDRIIAREETRWSLKWSARLEMRYLLELCGFEVVAEYSDFHKSPPTYGKEQIWVARKVQRAP
jgi:ubiquinone/menaquinone biosynthesis C-methylase UbiE